MLRDVTVDLDFRIGVPADEMAFIQDYDGDAAKLPLFRDVRAGKVRILFGSTQKMGTGTSVQERLIALHHLDAPWRPADVEQREGRILRQGNAPGDEFVARIFIYGKALAVCGNGEVAEDKLR